MKLSNPTELQNAIDGNRREGRRSSYGNYGDTCQPPMLPLQNLQSLQNLQNLQNPLSLVPRPQLNGNGTAHPLAPQEYLLGECWSLISLLLVTRGAYWQRVLRRWLSLRLISESILTFRNWCILAIISSRVSNLLVVRSWVKHNTNFWMLRWIVRLEICLRKRYRLKNLLIHSLVLQK